MKMTTKQFLQYLAGLAVAATAAPALANPVPRPQAVEEKVQFAENLGEKLGGVEAAWWPYLQFYKQTFGEMWMEYGFVEVQPHRSGEPTAALMPSEAFAKIRRS